MNATAIALCLFVFFVAVLLFAWSQLPRLEIEEVDHSDRIAVLTDDIALLTMAINKRKRNKKKASDLEAIRQAKRNEILRLEREY